MTDLDAIWHVHYSGPMTDCYVSQGRVDTQLECGETFNDNVGAHFPQSVSVKEYTKSVDIWQRYGQKFGGTFYGSLCATLAGARTLSFTGAGMENHSFVWGE